MDVGLLYLIEAVKGYRFELGNVSIYHRLSVLGVTQYVQDKLSIGIDRVSDFKFPEYL